MSRSGRFRPSSPELCVGLAMLAFAVVVGFATAAIPASAYAKVGPAVFPWAITAGLGLLGAVLVLQGLTGGWEHERGGALDTRSLAWLGAGLLLNVVLIYGVSVAERVLLPRIGFIGSSTALFVCTARAFGSDRPMRDGIVGVLLSIVSYVFFDRVLGYRIGTGVIEAWL